VIVAVAAVRLMQVAAHQVVDVVTMRHRFVATTWSMGVRFAVGAAGVVRGAGGRISATDGELMLVDMIAVRVVEMPVVQIVDVPLVLNRGVAAIRGVLVGVPFVDVVSIRHC
jgi:hypothetical protein